MNDTTKPEPAPLPPDALDPETPPTSTPVSAMRSFWGLMRAYWISERWREAWGLTLAVVALTALASKASVWIAQASGELVNTIAFYHAPQMGDPLTNLLHAVAVLVALVVMKETGIIGVRHLFSTTLHRKWRAWLDDRFNAALLDAKHTHFHVQHDPGDGEGGVGTAPDNIEQRVQESIKGMAGGAIGLAMGIIGVLTSLLFVGQKLLETSTQVAGLEFLGSYGSVTLAAAAIILYVPLNTLIAVKIGGILERLNNRMQRAEGSYRGELTTLLRNSFNVAASRGEAVQRDMHRRTYSEIDRTWALQNWASASYMSFELVYNFVAARVVAYGPGLIPYTRGLIDLKGYVTGAELVNAMISDFSWFIHVMPDIATLRANAGRVTSLAQAIENVQQTRAFYAQTGKSDFRYLTQDAAKGLTVDNLALMHQGTDAKPFLTVAKLNFGRGEWTSITGESGSGKTSLIKAINGLWPYGEGTVILPQGILTLYAAQDVRLPAVSLKQLVCLPARSGDYRDVDVIAALRKADLDELSAYLRDAEKEGMPWELVLSGGQKQKLIEARIVLQRPGLLFLDEAASALDVEAKISFHQVVRDNCPDAIVLSILHESVLPHSADGTPFYQSIVRIENGVATKAALRPLAAETGRG